MGSRILVGSLRQGRLFAAGPGCFFGRRAGGTREIDGGRGSRWDITLQDSITGWPRPQVTRGVETVRIPLPYAGGISCLTVDVNQLVKITSDHSRHLLQGADTVVIARQLQVMSLTLSLA